MAGRALDEVLEEWRDLERALRSPEHDDVTVERLRREIAILREEYRRLTTRQRANNDEGEAAERDSFRRLYDPARVTGASLDTAKRSSTLEASGGRRDRDG